MTRRELHYLAHGLLPLLKSPGASVHGTVVSRNCQICDPAPQLFDYGLFSRTILFFDANGTVVFPPRQSEVVRPSEPLSAKAEPKVCCSARAACSDARKIATQVAGSPLNAAMTICALSHAAIVDEKVTTSMRGPGDGPGWQSGGLTQPGRRPPFHEDAVLEEAGVGVQSCVKGILRAPPGQMGAPTVVSANLTEMTASGSPTPAGRSASRASSCTGSPDFGSAIASGMPPAMCGRPATSCARSCAVTKGRPGLPSSWTEARRSGGAILSRPAA